MTSYEQEYVTSVYEEIASHFNVTRVSHWPWVTNFVESLTKKSNILDIGCGNGRNMLYPNHNFIGIDNCKKFVTMCAEKNLNVLCGSMTELSFSSKTFDAILSIASFHHLKTAERRKSALSEMNRVLVPGGKVLLSVWSKEQPTKTRRIFDHYGDTLVPWAQKECVYFRYYYIFQKEEIESLFKEVGFKIKKHFWDFGNEVYILEKSEFI